jgi:hypothetical protein
MGVVIRPQAFVRGAVTSPPGGKPAGKKPAGRNPACRGIDGRLLSIVVAVIALSLILALAGAAFTIRGLLVLCFATLAGRARRVGLQQPRQPTAL